MLRPCLAKAAKEQATQRECSEKACATCNTTIFQHDVKWTFFVALSLPSRLLLIWISAKMIYIDLKNALWKLCTILQFTYWKKKITTTTITLINAILVHFPDYSCRLSKTPTFNVQVTKCMLDTKEKQTLAKQYYRAIRLNGTPRKPMWRLCAKLLQYPCTAGGMGRQHYMTIVLITSGSFQETCILNLIRAPFSKLRIPWQIRRMVQGHFFFILGGVRFPLLLWCLRSVRWKLDGSQQPIGQAVWKSIAKPYRVHKPWTSHKVSIGSWSDKTRLQVTIWYRYLGLFLAWPQSTTFLSCAMLLRNAANFE